MDEWQKWRSSTECAFDGSGCKQVLTDATYDARNIQMNRVVYSQLIVATAGGTANRLIKAYEDNKNLCGSWNSLCEWYDGDDVKN